MGTILCVPKVSTVGPYKTLPDPAERHLYEAAVAEWRQLRAKPRASRTAADIAKLKELDKYLSRFALDV
jgi:hypothetical protein